MPNRIDELFSPERLRRSWNSGTGSSAAKREDGQGEYGQEDKQSEKSQSEKSQKGVRPGAQRIGHEFHYLKRLIDQQFPGERGYALNLMMEELRALLTLRFPQIGEPEALEADQSALNAAIEKVLNQIEDLVEAFEL